METFLTTHSHGSMLNVYLYPRQGVEWKHTLQYRLLPTGRNLSAHSFLPHQQAESWILSLFKLHLLIDTFREMFYCVGRNFVFFFLFIYWSRKALRILDTYEAKNGKICNFWTIWPVIQLINDHLQIWLRHICPTVHRFISWITGQNVHKLQILLFSASYIASILKMECQRTDYTKSCSSCTKHLLKWRNILGYL